MLVTNHINANVLHTRKNTMDQSMKASMVIMPLFSLWICFTLPAALGVYWIGNSLFAMLSEFANIPFLRSFLKKQAEEKERRKKEAQERAAQERKAQAEAKKKAAEERHRIQMERKLNKSIASASREGLRTYARGRMYDPDRYPPPSPTRTPNKLARSWRRSAARRRHRRPPKPRARGPRARRRGPVTRPPPPPPQRPRRRRRPNPSPRRTRSRTPPPRTPRRKR